MIPERIEGAFKNLLVIVDGAKLTKPERFQLENDLEALYKEIVEKYTSYKEETKQEPSEAINS
jgi:hypothetical protein